MRVLSALGILAAASLGNAASLSSAPQDLPETSQLVDAAAAYVRQYQDQLTSVVADETYTQQIKAQVPLDKGMPPTRTLHSEIFFMFTPGHDWMAIRDVMQMDGRPLGDRPDLRLALQLLSPSAVAARFKAYNSRFNLGRITRNFNEPTLSLLPLDDRHRDRFSFERRRVEQVRGRALVTVSFKERRQPTLIRNLKGGPVYSTGEVTVEPPTGRVIRAVLAVAIDSVRITMTTTYAEDERLAIWVPVRFGEHYKHGTDARAPHPSGLARDAALRPVPQATTDYEEIVCEAIYSNFRRFEVKTQIR